VLLKEPTPGRYCHLPSRGGKHPGPSWSNKHCKPTLKELKQTLHPLSLVKPSASQKSVKTQHEARIKAKQQTSKIRASLDGLEEEVQLDPSIG